MVRQPDSVRAYDSSGRRARAAESRRRIALHAAELFVARGYAATTVADIASASAVSQPTVFAAFGSKAGLLKVCIDIGLAGDAEDVAVIDRPLARWVYDADDALELLGRYAVMMGVMSKQAAPIYSVLVRAADAEPELAGLVTEFERQRLRAATMLADAVVRLGGLPPGRSAEQARDVIWTLNAPELYVTLTGKRRWSNRQYVEWARDGLVKLIVEPPVPGPPPHR